MSPILPAILAVFVISLVIWLRIRSRKPAEPRGEADVLEPVRRGPESNAGALALEEPDDSDPPDLVGR